MDNFFLENGFHRKATDRHDERVTVKERSESHSGIRDLCASFGFLVPWKFYNSLDHGFKPSVAKNP